MTRPVSSSFNSDLARNRDAGPHMPVPLRTMLSYKRRMTIAATLVRDDMLGLADRLIHEIETGMVPVWPTTRAYAQKLVLGLRSMRLSRPEKVATIMELAPRDTPIDWSELMRTV